MKKILTLSLTLALLASLIGCDDSGINNEVTTPVAETVTEEAPENESVNEVIINRAEASFSAESSERIAVEADAATAVNYYLVARMYLDKFLQYDIDSGNPDDYSKLLEDAINAFNKVEEISSALEDSADNLESLEARTDVFKLFAGISYDKINSLNPFLLTVYASDESEAVKWAKDITERFDNAPAGKGIRTLAEQMGTDAKHAYAQLKQAQDILSGAAYDDFAETANTAYKTAMVLKTAGTAAQLTLSIVTANPVTTTEAVLTCGGILMNGINTMLEVGQTGSVLIVGDDNKLSAKLDNIESALAPIGATVGLFGFGSNLAKGADLLDDVPAMADSLMYMGTSLYDYMSEGKILGGTFTQGADGTISATLCDTMTIKNQWAKNPEEVDEILKTVGYTESEIAEIKETEQIDPAPFDQFADISIDGIESILEELEPVVSEIASSSSETEEAADEEALAETSNDKTESTADDETSGESAEDANDNSEESNSFPDISELAGEYDFYLYMTLGDQSGEAEAPQIITITGENTLGMTDDTGYTVSGKYDPSTGIAVFYDEDVPIKVAFTRNGNGSIHAKLSLNADGYSAYGSVDKR